MKICDYMWLYFIKLHPSSAEMVSFADSDEAGGYGGRPTRQETEGSSRS